MITDFPQTLELIAAIAGVICVYLQTRENIWAWPFGLLSVSILVYVFFQHRLYSDMILHFIYIGLNGYGWWYWTHNLSGEAKTPIKSLTNKRVAQWVLVVLVGTFIWGYGMTNYTDADLAYVDAFTTVGSLCAQFLLAKKIIQNWIFWIVVDVIAVNVYMYKELYFTAGMFLVFLLLCMKGFRDWRKTLASQQII